MENIDSIFVLNYSQQKLYLLDSNGIILKKYHIKANDNLMACPISTSRRILKIGNNILLPCHLNTYYTTGMKSNAMISLDLISGNRKLIVQYPEVFNKGAWVGQFKYIASSTYLAESNKLIVSFPIDPFLHTYIDGKEVSKNYVGSKYTQKLLPYSSENSYQFNKNISTERRDVYLATSHNFCGLWFLPQENIFLREIFIRPNEAEYKQNSKITKSSLIILDKDMVKKGEYMLPDSIYETAMTFINKDGFHIAKYSDYKNNENSLTFGVFKIKQK
jgi:hypothetical protein